MLLLNNYANCGFDTSYRYSLNLQNYKFHIIGKKENMIWNINYFINPNWVAKLVRAL